MRSPSSIVLFAVGLCACAPVASPSAPEGDVADLLYGAASTEAAPGTAPPALVAEASAPVRKPRPASPPRMSPEERAKKCAASPARAPAELDPPGAQPNSDTQGTSGRINPDVIQRPILERKDCMAACFSDALERDASLQGTVAIFFTIGADGRVSAASVSRTEIGDSAFLGCVLDELRALTFPAPNRGSVTVTYPLRFG